MKSAMWMCIVLTFFLIPKLRAQSPFEHPLSIWVGGGGAFAYNTAERIWSGGKSYRFGGGYGWAVRVGFYDVIQVAFERNRSGFAHEGDPIYEFSHREIGYEVYVKTGNQITNSRRYWSDEVLMKGTFLRRGDDARLVGIVGYRWLSGEEKLYATPIYDFNGTSVILGVGADVELGSFGAGFSLRYMINSMGKPMPRLGQPQAESETSSEISLQLNLFLGVGLF